MNSIGFSLSNFGFSIQAAWLLRVLSPPTSVVYTNILLGSFGRCTYPSLISFLSCFNTICTQSDCVLYTVTSIPITWFNFSFKMMDSEYNYTSLVATCPNQYVDETKNWNKTKTTLFISLVWNYNNGNSLLAVNCKVFSNPEWIR